MTSYEQILMSAMVKTNVMKMLHALIHLVAIPVTAILDTVEMERTVQVCAKDYFCHDKIDGFPQTTMNVRIQVEVYYVMRMLTAMTLMAVTIVFVGQDFQEMDSTALVCKELFKVILSFCS